MRAAWIAFAIASTFFLFEFEESKAEEENEEKSQPQETALAFGRSVKREPAHPCVGFARDLKRALLAHQYDLVGSFWHSAPVAVDVLETPRLAV
jgi:hypothetical protein